MKSALIKLFVIVICSLFFTGSSSAACTPGSSWTTAWTDSFGQTTYTLSAPCKVYVGVPFDITARVTDTTYANSDVGAGWSIIDNGSTVAGGGFNWITTTGGEWQNVLTQTYNVLVIDHIIQFKFTDMGQGGGGHFWGSAVIGALTVDPYPPSPNKPPIAEAGESIRITTEQLKTAVIIGRASDPEGNSLTYRWLEGNDELQSSQPVEANGSAPLNLAALSPLSIGSHIFTLEVSDGTSTSSDAVAITVENSAPVVVPSGAGTFQIREGISLRGTVADYDGDTLTYRWLEGDVIITSGSVSPPASGTPVALPVHLISAGLPLGSHTLTLEVSDGIHVISGTMTVLVVDSIAPNLAPIASKTILWPANGKMTDIIIKVNARDNSGQIPMIGVKVTSSIPPQTGRHGNAIPDFIIKYIDQPTGRVALRLRNGQHGSSIDQIYSVTITATDMSGNVSTSDLHITAPHDVGKKMY